MTKEQEEVIARLRAWFRGDACHLVSSAFTPDDWLHVIRAFRALEESEKPKPKVWTWNSRGTLVCSDSRRLHVCVHESFELWWTAGAAELVCKLLNEYEAKQPGVTYNVAGKCCTCKST